jgi:uncharacterized protein (DUF169 family)
MDLEAIWVMAGQMRDILQLSSASIGVSFRSEGSEAPGGRALSQHRFCQALMRARHGETVTLDGSGLACPAAAAAFGFRPLPEALRNGSGLVGFGIAQDPAVGQRMFEEMPRLAPNQIHSLRIFPLSDAPVVPDVVIVEDEVEKLMWISLAYLHAMGGSRIQSSTAILQATCVDAAIVPYLEGRLNFSYGCYGCRDATDLAASETVVGFPIWVLPGIMKHLEFLAQKAIPTSRSKKAWGALKAREVQQVEQI